jgi:hypothetical protein
MKKLFLIPILLMLAFTINAQPFTKFSNRIYDVSPVVNMVLGSGAQSSSTPFNVNCDMTWTLRVRCTNFDKFTGYLRLEWNDISTGTRTLAPVDSIPITSATMDFTLSGTYNNSDWWTLVYTGVTSTTGTISATLTGSLKYKY